MAQTPPDAERDRLPARVNRYAKVGGNMGGLAVKMMGRRILGFARDDARAARELTAALGGLKGPLMKVAQLLATIPDLLPPEYAQELATLQAQAPAMGWPFVRRRMRKELGENWQEHFASFDTRPSAAASLGQVHQAESHDGEKLACKLQYPDMTSAVEADLRQLRILFSLHRRMRPAIDT